MRTYSWITSHIFICNFFWQVLVTFPSLYSSCDHIFWLIKFFRSILLYLLWLYLLLDIYTPPYFAFWSGPPLGLVTPPHHSSNLWRKSRISLEILIYKIPTSSAVVCSIISCWGCSHPRCRTNCCWTWLRRGVSSSCGDAEILLKRTSTAGTCRTGTLLTPSRRARRGQLEC